MPRHKLSREAEMVKLALTGLPESWYQQEHIADKLAKLVDVCLNAANLDTKPEWLAERIRARKKRARWKQEEPLKVDAG